MLQISYYDCDIVSVLPRWVKSVFDALSGDTMADLGGL